jgi:hypothetical protein
MTLPCPSGGIFCKFICTPLVSIRGDQSTLAHTLGQGSRESQTGSTRASAL